MIVLEKLTKTYGSFTAVNEVSLEVKEGETSVLIGPSGCGKTTTMEMMNRLREPSSGTVYIDGVNIAGVDPVRLRRDIGYVIQDVGLFPHWSVEKNVTTVLALKKWSRSKQRERAAELLHLVGMDPTLHLDRYPDELSGGQKQRIGVARALAANPPIVLMDEPFGAVDPITRDLLRSELMELQKKLRKTVVFVTHDMDEAFELGNKIAIMKDGVILQYGHPADILRNPVSEFVERFIGKKRFAGRVESLTVTDIMLERPVTCEPHWYLETALERMRMHHVDSLLVVEKGMVVGKLGVYDIQAHWKEIMKCPKALKVIEIMDRNIPTILHDRPATEAWALMETAKVRFIAVLDSDGSLKGIVTRGSAVALLASLHEQKEGEAG